MADAGGAEVGTAALRAAAVNGAGAAGLIAGVRLAMKSPAKTNTSISAAREVAIRNAGNHWRRGSALTCLAESMKLRGGFTTGNDRKDSTVCRSSFSVALSSGSRARRASRVAFSLEESWLSR
jgi:hypothetical protein